MRGMLGVVIDRLAGYHDSGVDPRFAAVIQVPIEAWEIAARNLNPNPVPLQKRLARDSHLDPELVYSTRFQEDWFLERFPESGSQNSLTDVDRPAIRMDIQQSSRPVCIQT